MHVRTRVRCSKMNSFGYHVDFISNHRFTYMHQILNRTADESLIPKHQDQPSSQSIQALKQSHLLTDQQVSILKPKDNSGRFCSVVNRLIMFSSPFFSSFILFLWNYYS